MEVPQTPTSVSMSSMCRRQGRTHHPVPPVRAGRRTTPAHAPVLLRVPVRAPAHPPAAPAAP